MAVVIERIPLHPVGQSQPFYLFITSRVISAARRQCIANAEHVNDA
jgi:hypothetical protein